MLIERMITMIPSITSMKDAFSLKGKNALITGGNRGLGLAIARNIVDAHKGKIHAESEYGKSATFVVALP